MPSYINTAKVFADQERAKLIKASQEELRTKITGQYKKAIAAALSPSTDPVLIHQIEKIMKPHIQQKRIVLSPNIFEITNIRFCEGDFEEVAACFQKLESFVSRNEPRSEDDFPQKGSFNKPLSEGVPPSPQKLSSNTSR